MPQVVPFKGWRYDPGKVNYGDVVAPPASHITPAIAEMLYCRHPNNCVRLLKGKPLDTDSGQNNWMTRATSHLDAWREKELFLQDRPAVYVYEQNFEYFGTERRRTGFIAKVLLSDWGSDHVFPVEKGFDEVDGEALELMRALRGQATPILSMIPDSDLKVSVVCKRIAAYEPLTTIDAEDGSKHRFWVVDHGDNISALMNVVSGRPLVVVDGQVAYATALAYRNDVRERIKLSGQKPPALGELECDYAMMYIVPDSEAGLEPMPVHRLLNGVAGFDVKAFLKACTEDFEVTKVGCLDGIEKGLYEAELPAFGFVSGQDKYVLTLSSDKTMKRRAPLALDAWRETDIAVLHLLVLEGVLGIDDSSIDAHVKQWANTGEAVARAESSDVQAAFIMRAPKRESIIQLAEAGHLLPEGSVSFHPPALSGLVFHLFW
ncbi:MAG: DUF1015 domain-containing protein [Planctomycetes bacterium]|nr:DUF1015 domain-containing protein [Planctomycetota bacterium]